MPVKRLHRLRERMRQDERGVSNTIGIALLISIVLLSATFSLAVQTETINQYQSIAEVNTAEDSMMFLSSEIASVAHSDSAKTGSLEFSGIRYGSVKATSNGHISVTLVNANTFATTTVLDQDLGTVQYVGKHDSKIVYQGGGVWRVPRDGGDPIIVTPPPIRYDGNTLNLPVTRIDESRSTIQSQHIQIREVSQTHIYPNPDNNYENPTNDYYVVIEVTGELYRGWGEFFEERTPATVTYFDSDNRVRVRFDLTGSQHYIHITDSVVSLS